MGREIGVMLAQGLDVPNCFKDVPNLMKYISNFVKDLPNFLQDVPWVPMSISRWGTTSNSFSRVKEYMNDENGDKGLGSSKNGYTQGSKVPFGMGEDL